MKPNLQKPQHHALITGASSGIGYQYARLLAAEGYDLVIVSNEAQQITTVGNALRETFGVRVTALYQDLAHPDAARTLFETCQRQGIVVEVLINNAGVFFFNDLTEVESHQIELMLNLHIHTPTLLCHYFGHDMKTRGKGYILNMSSISAWMPFPGISVYASSKSYLKVLSKAIHTELYDSGVHVTAICPGAVATDLYNLSNRYQRLAIRLGIMMTPERLARKALRALFAGRRCVVPGALNGLLVVLSGMIPQSLIRRIKQTSKVYRYGK